MGVLYVNIPLVKMTNAINTSIFVPTSVGERIFAIHSLHVIHITQGNYSMKKTLLCLALLGAVGLLNGQSVEGLWRTVDDATGESKSHLRLYQANGKLYGKVEQTLRKNAKQTCDKCSGDKKDKPIVGMVVLDGLYMKDNFWQGGTILDPEKGKTYNCKLWLKAGDPNVLEVRGSIGPFYRTQNWYRVK